MSQLTLHEVAAPGTPSTGKVTLYAKSDGILYWKDDAGTERTILIPASQADEETGTSNAVATTPAIQQFHPSAAKGWVSVGSTGNIQNSYNVSSVTDTATGQCGPNWGTDFSSAAYAVFALIQQAISGSATEMFASVDNSKSGAGCVISCTRVSDDTLADPQQYHVIGFGDQ